ncbi:MAG: hypothetical protein R2939_12910 [Kofleriaceae bacterium]
MTHRGPATTALARGVGIATTLAAIACGPRPAPTAPTPIGAVGTDADVAAAPAPTEDAEARARRELIDAIAALSQPGSSAWDHRVTELLLPRFDADDSGALDTEAEVDAIGCEVLVAIDAALQRKRQRLAYTYGVHEDYGWSAMRWASTRTSAPASIEPRAAAA